MFSSYCWGYPLQVFCFRCLIYVYSSSQIEWQNRFMVEMIGAVVKRGVQTIDLAVSLLAT